MTIDGDLANLGFDLAQTRRDGSRQYTRRATPYLVYWLTGVPNGRGELTWELSLGQYLSDRGFSVSGQDELSLLMFPGAELTGTFDTDWVQQAVALVEDALGALDFAHGG